jgi:hypothetical protein
MPVFTILINDTKPLWYYCATGKHCQSGMAGVINPPTGGNRTIEAYKTAAEKVEVAGVPRGGGSGGSASSGSGGGSGNGTSGSTGTPSSSAAPSGTGSSGAVEVLARGWVAVVVGALAGLIAVV